MNIQHSKIPAFQHASITSPANPRVKALAKLAEKKYRAESGLFWLEGADYVARAVQAGWEVVEVWGLEEPLNIPTYQHTNIRTSEAVLARITGKTNPQPVLGVVRQRWRPLPEKPTGLWLALDRPRDPGNVGTIIRTAEAAGVAGVVLVGESTDPFAPECVRATVGSLVNMPLVRCREADFLAWAAGKQVLGTRMDGAEDFRALTPANPCVLLMGNESEGLSAPLTAACTHTVRIPMVGQVESLNLAVATALMLYALQRDRLPL